MTSVSQYNVSDVLQEKVEYTYDAFNRRVAKDLDEDGDGDFDGGQRFVYDGARIALVFDETGALTNRYLHGTTIDMILADEQVTSTSSPGTVLWPLTDHLGTVRDILQYSSGTTSVVNHIRYDSFGNVTAETNPSVDHAFGFTGRERDEETGLVYYRTRYLDPATGRWLGEDLIGFAAGDPNLTRYVGNAVTSYIDPFGLSGAAAGAGRRLGKHEAALYALAIAGGGGAGGGGGGSGGAGGPLYFTNSNGGATACSGDSNPPPDDGVGRYIAYRSQIDYEDQDPGAVSQIWANTLVIAVPGSMADTPASPVADLLAWPIGFGIGLGLYFSRKADIKFIDDIAREFGLSREQRRLLHEEIHKIGEPSEKEIRDAAGDVKELYPNK